LYSSSHPIDNLSVDLDGGERLRLVFKDLSPGTMLREARKIRPPFLYEPMREIATHERILSQRDFGTPAFYGAVVSPRSGRYWLFLERVSGPLLCQTGPAQWWDQAARWLATFHGAMESGVRAANRSGELHLLEYDRAFLHEWLVRAEDFLRRKPAVYSPVLGRRFGKIAGRYERVIQRLLALPQTMIHGEFYPSNVIIRHAPGNRSVCPTDWELTAIAPGLIDLAALTLGDWAEDQRSRMLRAYRDALEPNHGWPPSLEQLSEAVTYCQVHLCMQWLGWAPKWSPPASHGRDWLEELVRSADQLGL
jgi:Ser/Thr protein kinase RdoA (MazF antagonist)